MVDLSGIVGIPFLKKSRFTGSDKDICFALEKRSEQEKDFVAAIVWPGPNCFDATPKEEKTTELFELTEEGLKDAIAWINQQGV